MPDARRRAAHAHTAHRCAEHECAHHETAELDFVSAAAPTIASIAALDTASIAQPQNLLNPVGNLVGLLYTGGMAEAF